VRISKELKVGILAIVSMAILYFGFKFLKGIDFLASTNTYYALYDNISGLPLSNPVTVNGLTVGRVNAIRILQERDNVVLVEMHLGEDILLPQGTNAMLVNLDFLGSKAIELHLADNADRMHQDGDTLRSEIEQGLESFLKENAGPVADNLSATIENLNSLLATFNRNSERFDSILKNVDGITATLDKELPGMETRIDTLLTGFNKNSEQLSEILEGLKPVVAKADQVADSLTAMELNATLLETKRVMQALAANLEMMKEGEGSMGKLMTDDSLYIHLSNTARDLDKLLVDMRENPGRYVQFSVFGKKDKSN
jgi:phospholipid/cholesterol/gamma-HCH transport system substrate-binding protein